MKEKINYLRCYHVDLYFTKTPPVSLLIFMASPTVLINYYCMGDELIFHIWEWAGQKKFGDHNGINLTANKSSNQSQHCSSKI